MGDSYSPFKEKAELVKCALIDIYAKDQVIGRSIHDAYRKAILAATEGAGNVDELIADILSTAASLPTFENQLELNDEALKSFSQEAKTTADSMESLFQSNRTTASRIWMAVVPVVRSTRMNRPPGCMTEEQFQARQIKLDRNRRLYSIFPMETNGGKMMREQPSQQNE